jgi:hypothetical protein
MSGSLLSEVVAECLAGEVTDANSDEDERASTCETNNHRRDKTASGNRFRNRTTVIPVVHHLYLAFLLVHKLSKCEAKTHLPRTVLTGAATVRQ